MVLRFNPIIDNDDDTDFLSCHKLSPCLTKQCFSTSVPRKETCKVPKILS
jgi:hypothetical protein